MLYNSSFRDIVNFTIGIIVTFNKYGEIVMINKSAEEEMGYQDGEKIYVWQVFRQLFSKETDIKKFMAKKQKQDLEAVIYRKNKTCFPASVRFGQINVDDGLYVCSITNITTQKELIKEVIRAEEEKKEALNVRNEFVANVTHELRTPVNGIKGHVKYLMDQKEMKSEYMQALQIIDKCCDNMSEIINNILDISKIHTGKMLLEVREFQLRKCLDHVIDTNIKIANEKGIALTLSVADNVPDAVIGDELRMIQILNNLVSNALKFTYIGYVKIEVAKIMHVGNELELFFMVIDTGIGIAAEDKERIFESFMQSDSSITRKYGGTGLGLAIARELVTIMNGTINCESEIGKGSTFSFTIFLHTKEKSLNKGMKILQDTNDAMRVRSKKELEKMENLSAIYEFGTQENRAELKRNMEKLIICIEMGTWKQAEDFARNIKKLVEKADNIEYRRKAFKLEMLVRKEDYDNSVQLFGEIKELLKL